MNSQIMRLMVRLDMNAFALSVHTSSAGLASSLNPESWQKHKHDLPISILEPEGSIQSSSNASRVLKFDARTGCPRKHPGFSLQGVNRFPVLRGSVL